MSAPLPPTPPAELPPTDEIIAFTPIAVVLATARMSMVPPLPPVSAPFVASPPAELIVISLAI